MTRLDAILKGCSLLDDLFGFRKKEVRRKLEAAKDECEEVKVRYQISYKKTMQKLGEDEADYESIINDLLTAKEGIINAEATLKALEEIEQDLNEEVKVSES